MFFLPSLIVKRHIQNVLLFSPLVDHFTHTQTDMLEVTSCFEEKQKSNEEKKIYIYFHDTTDALESVVYIFTHLVASLLSQVA